MSLLERWTLSLMVCALGATACRKAAPPEIHLVIDEGGPRKIRFAAESAFAEYIELADHHHELRVVLADYQTSCDDFAPPERGQTLLSLLIVTPSASPPSAGHYPWKAGIDPSMETDVTAAYSVPKVHANGRSFLFQPGGGVELSSVELGHHGHVKGLLGYEYSGGSEHAATAIRGSFEARFCRFREAPPE